MRNGIAYQLPQLVRLTDATESGSWPTPGATEAKSDTLNINNRLKRGKQVMLCHAVRMWPTPTVQDSANNGGASQYERNSLPLNAVVGGSLSPNWVEALMGFPFGYTDLSDGE